MRRQLDEQVTVSGQVAPEEVAGLAASGVSMLINNRPDGEDDGQPTAGDIEAAAEKAGLAYRFIPIMRGIGPGDVEAMQEAIEEAGDGQVLAFCRSGNRSALVSALARRRQGRSSDEVVNCLNGAGIDPSPIAHLL